MDWLQFFASLITSLAWPVTLLAVVFMLRSNIGALFPYIERLKYKGFGGNDREVAYCVAPVSDSQAVTPLSQTATKTAANNPHFPEYKHLPTHKP